MAFLVRAGIATDWVFGKEIEPVGHAVHAQYVFQSNLRPSDKND
jgi:hypothetical protein